MEQLIETRGQDTVSELLLAVRVRSTVYCRSVMGAPWGFGVEAHGNPAFHLVTGGGCWLQVGGQTEQVALAAGDLVVLPTGRRHVVRDDPATPAPELDEILTETPPDEHRRLRHGGPGPRTELLCGGFAIEGPGVHPILRALPPLVHIRGAAGRPLPWVAASIQVLAAVTSSNAPGAEPVIQRLADALLTQTLRIALAEPDARLSAHLSAWRDPEIAAAIELIH